VFVGWGAQPDFSEYPPDGRQIFNGSYAEGVMSYRAYRFVWNGQPTTRPAMAVAAPSGARVRLWASWNGATDVAWWRVLGGSARRRLRPLEVVRLTGFETSVTVPAHPRYLAVQALDAGHHVLRTSWSRAVPAHGA
jgi:hypothetical protein